MDPTNNEQTEILREIWKQLVATDRNLSNRIDQTNARLDHTNATLMAFIEQTQANFARVQRNFEAVQRNFERVDERFVEASADRDRARDVDARLTRLEAHVGLRDP